MMKFFFKSLLLIIAVLVVLVLNMLHSTGFFREIVNSTDYSIEQSYNVWGSEDMAISRTDSFLIISSDDRAAKYSDRERTGGLWRLDLKTTDAKPQLISQNFQNDFFPHGISMLQLDSATYKIWAINHVEGQHSIEVFHLIGDSLSHQQTIKDKLLLSPNDIVAVDEQRFYYTNDRIISEGFGFFAANYLGQPNSNVGYYDGEHFSIVAKALHYANGINFDKEKELLYIASLRKFMVKVYKRQQDGSLHFIEDIACKTGVDNIELDENGDLWMGCHPNLMAAKNYLQDKIPYAPSEVVHIQYKDIGDYVVRSIFEDDGQRIPACSVALPFGDQIYIGNVSGSQFVTIKNN